MPDLWPPSLPAVAIAGGVLLLLWTQVRRVGSLLPKLRAVTKAKPSLGPHELFERLYDLRTWCESAGQAEAVRSLDASVLPAIVRGGPQPEGGAKP